MSANIDFNVTAAEAAELTRAYGAASGSLDGSGSFEVTSGNGLKGRFIVTIGASDPFDFLELVAGIYTEIDGSVFPSGRPLVVPMDPSLQTADISGETAAKARSEHEENLAAMVAEAADPGYLEDAYAEEISAAEDYDSLLVEPETDDEEILDESALDAWAEQEDEKPRKVVLRRPSTAQRVAPGVTVEEE